MYCIYNQIKWLVKYNSTHIYIYTYIYIYIHIIYIYHSSFKLSPWRPHCIPIGWILLNYEEQIYGVTAGTSKCTPQISRCYHALEPWEQPHRDGTWWDVLIGFSISGWIWGYLNLAHDLVMTMTFSRFAGWYTLRRHQTWAGKSHYV